MAITSTTNRVQYNTNGVTSSFAYAQKFIDDADLVVVLTDDDGNAVTQVLGTDYTVSGAGDASGGSVDFVNVPADGYVLTIYCDPSLTQGLDLLENDALPAEDVEEAFDRAVLIDQRQRSLVDRAITLRDDDEDADLELPLKADRANQFLGFDSDGEPVAMTAIEEGANVSAYGATLLDDANAAEARATLGFLDTFGAVGAGNFGISAVSAMIAALNCTFEASVAASALTIALKTNASATPSSNSPIPFFFRSPTATAGAHERVDVNTANSITVSSGSTLGVSNSQAFRLWLVAFNDNGTVRLGVINCKSGTNIYPLNDGQIASSTLEDGVGGADSAQVFYTAGAAVTSKALRVLGYLEWSSGLATAGTWSVAPDKVQFFGPGIPLPGQMVQSTLNTSGGTATGSTTIPADDTIPQNTEGDQYFTQAITPRSAANVLRIESQLMMGQSTDALNNMIALFQDSTANALCASAASSSGANLMILLHLYHEMLAATTSSTTFKIRAGATGGAMTLNGFATARKLGGVGNSFLRIQEVMG